MLKVAICEDDLFYIEKEKMLIESYLHKCKIRSEIVTFTSSKELVRTYANSFDIIFLDIELDGMNGIEAASKGRIEEFDPALMMAIVDHFTVHEDGRLQIRYHDGTEFEVATE